MQDQVKWWKSLVFQAIAGIIFYTSIPLPYVSGLEFSRVAKIAPVIGLIIGGILGILDIGMNHVGVPVFTRSALVIAAWIAVTGGLHLDGVMDTADGLAVGDPQKRLEVMADSATGAFGAMAAIVIILIKTSALIDIQKFRWLCLMVACGWGRWGQQIAIVFYPYLKPTGKGAIHKEAFGSYWDLIPGCVLISITGFLSIVLEQESLVLALVMTVAGGAIATLVSAWFDRKLGGHTGDTYGAVVEWTEALTLSVFTMFT